MGLQLGYCLRPFGTRKKALVGVGSVLIPDTRRDDVYYPPPVGLSWQRGTVKMASTLPVWTNSQRR